MTRALAILLSTLLAWSSLAQAQEESSAESDTSDSGQVEASPAGEAPATPENLPADASGMRIAVMAVCEAVEEREPIGESEVFSSDVGHLYCFTAVQGATPPTQVYHRWYVGDRLINEIPIDVDGTRWRCWSRKTILPRWKGSCRVEVVNEEGDILGMREFTLE